MSKYPVLRTLAFIARVSGWIAIALGGFVLLLGLFHGDVSQTNPFGSSSGSQAVVERIVACVVAIVIAGFGLWLVIIGELIQVFLDIEENTRETALGLRTFKVEAGNGAALPLQENASSSQTCSSCGTENERGSKFCEQCGKAL